MKQEKQFLSTPTAVLIGAVIISLSILMSGGIIKFKGVSGSRDQALAPVASSAPAPDAAVPEPDSGPVKVALDDDPVIGDKNAPVTLIEFSDYECPFCKRHFDQVYPELKKNYIDTGKVKLVFRDLPLSFHDPNATEQAVAANCAREQGGDATYFKYHDEIFKRTTSNKTFAKENLPKIAADLGLNTSNFQSCLDSNKYKDEVTKDLNYAATVGASGTPTFFVGKSEGSEITATRIVGAQPYSAFQTQIDVLLK
ncbi:MAG: DSBA oxidoreductase [Candidatus Daviesbacteria bacterium GW2011_GWA2_38_24]|uniref:DSBA oxidoreductase n=1 Tax=Candidatus Daviesbacteria bacterium GW2011_GWA2_38_24 TaxID=1618422 RepID=A0A0G0JKF0_9BACT|nr:MAG: DSBA oxidoreductase [Candidatus Daviesbacteria bacterium GW2011_GWA2_38_24]OGE24716.1 MAG: hypothetical protein A2688_01765 [Candidatus Daviesbacteria bacterium RIFCSPHIGHO2_01_FULL_38_8]